MLLVASSYLNRLTSFCIIDYSSLLVAFSPDLTSVLERAAYVDGPDPFLPLNVLIALVASYGITI